MSCNNPPGSENLHPLEKRCGALALFAPRAHTRLPFRRIVFDRSSRLWFLSFLRLMPSGTGTTWTGTTWTGTTWTGTGARAPFHA